MVLFDLLWGSTIDLVMLDGEVPCYQVRRLRSSIRDACFAFTRSVVLEKLQAVSVGQGGVQLRDVMGQWEGERVRYGRRRISKIRAHDGPSACGV